jgi:hypothetical protein
MSDFTILLLVLLAFGFELYGLNRKLGRIEIALFEILDHLRTAPSTRQPLSETELRERIEKDSRPY